MTRRLHAIVLGACLAMFASGFAVRGAVEPPPGAPSEPPASGAEGAHAPASDGVDDAERIKVELERTHADMERRLKVVEEAQAMLQRGESLDAVRDFLKSKNMNIMARIVDERRRGPAAGPAGARGLGMRDRSERGMRRLMADRDGPPPGGPGEPPRDGPGPGGPGREGRPPLMITVEEHQVIRDVLVQLMPHRLAELDELAAKDPAEGEREFGKLVNSSRIRALIELRRSNPEAFRLRIEEFTAAAECSRRARDVVEFETKGAPAETIAAARAALRAAAERLFDKRIDGLSMEVERLADKAASLRTELDEQTAHRAEHIDRSVEEAIERAKRPPGPPPGGLGGRGEGDGPPPPRERGRYSR